MEKFCMLQETFLKEILHYIKYFIIVYYEQQMLRKSRISNKQENL